VLLRLPRYLLHVLIREQHRVEAQHMRRLMTATSAPYLKASDRADLIRRIERAADLPEPPASPMPKERIDPEAAAAWFAARGIRVETS
jgi:hypothetical protein